jgi:hypothetical protein
VDRTVHVSRGGGGGARRSLHASPHKQKHGVSLRKEILAREKSLFLLDKISQVFGHLLDLSFVKVSNVVEILLVANGDEIDSNPLPPIPSTTTDTMDVVLAVCG